MAIRRVLHITRAKLWGFVNWRRSYYITLAESAIYLVLLGSGLAAAVETQRVGDVSLPYLEFLFVGLIAVQTFRVFSQVLFTSSNDMKWGMYRMYVFSGASAVEYTIARGLDACVYVLAQWAVLTFGAALILGPQIALAGVLLLLLAIPGVLFWAFLGVIIGTLVRDYGTRDMLSEAVLLPVVFSSTALYDTAGAPLFLRVLSALNPLSYQADGLRLAYVGDWYGALPQFAVLVAATLLLLVAASKMLPRAALASTQRI